MALRSQVTAYGSPMSQHGRDSPRGSAPGTKTSHHDQSGLTRGSSASLTNLGRGDPLTAPTFKLNTNQAPSGNRHTKDRGALKDRDDPFITQTDTQFLNTSTATLITSKTTAEQKLSPTASSFTPIAKQLFAGYGGLRQSSNAPKISPLDPHPYGTSFVNAPSMTGSSRGMFAQSQRSPLRAGLNDEATNESAPSTSCGGYSSRPRLCPGTSEFAKTYFDPTITRAIAVTNFETGATTTIDSILQSRVPNAVNKKVHLPGATPMICMSFFDKLDAQKILAHLRFYYPHWTVSYMTAAAFITKLTPSYGDDYLDDGEIIVEAKYTKNDSRGIDLDVVDEYIIDLLKNHGDICAIKKINDPKDAAASFRAEFIDCRDAKRAAIAMHGYRVMNCVFSVGLNRLYGSPSFDSHSTGQGVASWDLTRDLQSMSLRTPPSADRSFSDGMDPRYPYYGTPRGTIYGSGQTSPPYENDFGTVYTPSATPNHGDHPDYAGQSWELPGTIGQERDDLFRTPKHYARLSPQRQTYLARYPPRREYRELSPQHGVDVNRIMAGLDVRTTIMLRNIPNKIQLPELEEIVNDTSYGRYNFMYLRIDFANNCNVGYAFINFEDPYSIVEFVQARAGKRWNVYNSDKVAEVSYATIQGQDCLLSKFRNSSVMRENPLYRPKIYHTGNHPQAGEEAPFPGPDNQMKLRRSMENAETIGLFKPRSGHKHQEDRRRFQSQYDRGTRFAAMEEERFERMERYHGRGILSSGSHRNRSGFSPIDEDYCGHRQHVSSNGPPRMIYPKY